MLFNEATALVEYSAFLMSLSVLALAPKGEPHPVLVLPPFTADDRITQPLRWFLRTRGHNVHGWDLGLNLMRTRRLVTEVPRRLRELHETYGEPISLVGWSAGGIWARHLARDHPTMVRQVITLASPFRLRPGARTNASMIYDMIAHTQVAWPRHLHHAEGELPLPVPITSIYTRTDGVASWEHCLEARGPHRENIEVRGTHTGMGYNPSVPFAVPDRPAQPRGSWRPFGPPVGSRHHYPVPAYWNPAVA